MANTRIGFLRPFLGTGLLVLALLACGLGAPSATPPPAGEGETQATQPTSPPAFPSTGDVDCGNTYYPVVEGASKTFAGSTSLGGTYTEVNTITDVGTSGFLVQVDLTNIQWVETWECTADGLAQLMSDGGQWSLIMSGPSGTATVATLSQTGVTYPLRINPGDSWSQETTFHLASPEENGDGSLVYAFHAVGPEEITVPAGTFQAMRVDVTADAVGPTVTVHYGGTAWWVPEFGRVKQTGETSLDEDPNPSSATVELESYLNP